MSIGFNFDDDETPIDRLKREYFEDTPIGAPCKSDFSDEFDNKLNLLESRGIDLTEKTLYEVKEMEIPKKDK